MNLMYNSTRSHDSRVTASQAILQGLSRDGGLYVPEAIPKLTHTPEELARLDYRELAYEILRLYLTDYTEAELRDCIAGAYDDKFDTPDIAPLVKVGQAYYLELFHGATMAFKDMALSILPHLLKTAARKNNITDNIIILTATSGDTGKAALAGFADVEGTQIIVFYPKNGVSPVQEKQMVTQKGKNTHVIGVIGNFDDTQTGVKAIFNNRELAERMKNNGYRFSSANSINIGRLLPQIVYYIHAYVSLYREGSISEGEGINFVVPTGNFGNILAGYYAKSMGLPINKLICASNENKVLFDFFTTGIYDRNRKFILTTSPSMDILISSNLERLIYHTTGDDAARTAELMQSLAEKGRYEVTQAMRENMEDFLGGFADMQDTRETIHKTHIAHGYVLDPHTAVAAHVYDKYREETKDVAKTVIISTASPYKFAESVLKAVDRKDIPEDDYEQAGLVEQISGVRMPRAMYELHNAQIMHKKVCNADKMQAAVEDILKII